MSHKNNLWWSPFATRLHMHEFTRAEKGFRFLSGYCKYWRTRPLYVGGCRKLVDANRHELQGDLQRTFSFESLLVPILIRQSPETAQSQPKLAHWLPFCSYVSSIISYQFRVLQPQQPLFTLISFSLIIFNSKAKVRLVLYNTAVSLPALIDGEIVSSRVLSGISLFVVKILHETIISRRNRGAQKWPNPVNPVVSRKPSPSNSRAKASRRV